MCFDSVESLLNTQPGKSIIGRQLYGSYLRVAERMLVHSHNWSYPWKFRNKTICYSYQGYLQTKFFPILTKVFFSWFTSMSSLYLFEWLYMKFIKFEQIQSFPKDLIECVLNKPDTKVPPSRQVDFNWSQSDIKGIQPEVEITSSSIPLQLVPPPSLLLRSTFAPAPAPASAAAPPPPAPASPASPPAPPSPPPPLPSSCRLQGHRVICLRSRSLL